MSITFTKNSFFVRRIITAIVKIIAANGIALRDVADFETGNSRRERTNL
jgi:hypothetical protein